MRRESFVLESIRPSWSSLTSLSALAAYLVAQLLPERVRSYWLLVQCVPSAVTRSNPARIDVKLTPSSRRHAGGVRGRRLQRVRRRPAGRRRHVHRHGRQECVLPLVVISSRNCLTLPLALAASTWSQPESLAADSTLPWTPRVPSSSNCKTYSSADLFPVSLLGYQVRPFSLLRAARSRLTRRPPCRPRPPPRPRRLHRRWRPARQPRRARALRAKAPRRRAARPPPPRRRRAARPRARRTSSSRAARSLWRVRSSLRSSRRAASL